MSTIRPVEFPRVDPESLKKTVKVPPANQSPRTADSEKTVKKSEAGVQQTAARPGSESERSEKQAETTGFRFYQPRTVKVKNVSELGKNIDVRV